MVPTRCVFDYGVVPNGTVFSGAPASDDEAAMLVFYSQLATLRNGGTRGIYRKMFTDNEVQMFRPDPKDTHGAWNCANIKNDTVPWTGPVEFMGVEAGISPTDWQMYLDSTAYMYRSGPKAWDGTIIGNNLINDFIIWSAPNGKDFDSVRVSILNYGPIVAHTPQAMDFDCALTVKRPVPQMEVAQVLSDWVSKAYGYQKSLYTMEDAALWLGLTLDAITTLSLFIDALGAQNIVPADDIGCVVEGTRVSVGILSILALVVVVLFSILIAEGYVLLASPRNPSKEHAALLPFDLADWQLATYRQSTGKQARRVRDLQSVSFRYDPSKDMLCMGTTLTDPAGRLGKQDAGHSAVETTWFEVRDHGVPEYNQDHAGASSVKPFQIRRKPMVKTYMQVPSTTELNSI